MAETDGLYANSPSDELNGSQSPHAGKSRLITGTGTLLEQRRAYEKFDQYCESGARFVTQLKHNACIREVEEERPVDPNSSVLRNAIIWLGQYPGYGMHAKLHLVEVRGDDGKTVQLLTNDLDMERALQRTNFRRAM